MSDRQQNNGWDKRRMTDMVKEKVDINEHNRGTPKYRPGDAKFDNHDNAKARG